jgi:hypothetical protein
MDARRFKPGRVLALAGVVLWLIVAMPVRRSRGESRSEAPRAPLGAYYRCHGRTAAFREVLRLFRASYPAAPLFVANDGGSDELGSIALEHGAAYVYEARVSASATGLFLESAEAALHHLRGVAAVAEVADWVLLLEDDVHVLAPVRLETLQCDVNGDNPHALLRGRLLEELEAAVGPLPDRHYGGAGGAVLRGAFLRDRDRWEPWVLRLAGAGGRVASDELIRAIPTTRRRRCV